MANLLAIENGLYSYSFNVIGTIKKMMPVKSVKWCHQFALNEKCKIYCNQPTAILYRKCHVKKFFILGNCPDVIILGIRVR